MKCMLCCNEMSILKKITVSLAKVFAPISRILWEFVAVDYQFILHFGQKSRVRAYKKTDLQFKSAFIPSIKL